MSSVETDARVIRDNFDCLEDSRPTGLTRRCSSVQPKKLKKDSGDHLDYLRDSTEDLLSSSSGISGFFIAAQPEVHGSLHHRPRGQADVRPGAWAEDLKQLSANLSDSSVSSLFSLEATSKKNIVALPSDPFKILDIPGVEDDYYTNLLSWSYQDQIGICLDNTVYLFDYRTNDITTFYEAYKVEKVTSLTFDPYGERLAMGNILGQVSIWDVERKKELLCIDKHIDRVSCLDWSDKGLLSGSKDKNVFWCDIRMRRFTAAKYQGHTQEVCGIKWNSDNTRFASGGNDNRAFAWETTSTKPLMTLNHRAGVKALCWATNHRDILITGGGLADRTIKSWNIGREKLMFSRDIEGQVCALAFSKLTNDVISARGSADNDIEVWRSNGFKKVGTLSGHSERPLYLAWSPKGDVLLSVSSDETMRFWQVYQTQTRAKHYDNVSSYEGCD
jgi:cell division cycle 20-like protein 1 (cofactor of APC complex)